MRSAAIVRMGLVVGWLAVLSFVDWLPNHDTTTLEAEPSVPSREDIGQDKILITRPLWLSL